MLNHLLNTPDQRPIYEDFGSKNTRDWDWFGVADVADGQLVLDTTAGQHNYIRSKYYLDGDFEIQGKVTITGRSAGKIHWTRMWISREADNACFAENRNTWDSTSGWSPQWRGWDSCSPVTSMGVVGTTTTASEALMRMTRVSNRIRTYVKHSDQAGYPDSAWILTGDDTSFTSGVPGTADCNISLGAASLAPNNPTGNVRFSYFNVVSGVIVYP